VHPVAAVQSEYSLWSREPEHGILAACRELGAGLVAYSPLGRGYLAGNFRSLQELPPDDNRRNQPRFQDENVLHNNYLVHALTAIATRKGCSLPQLALAWVLAQGPDVTPIPGMKTRAHLQDNLAALEVVLSGAEEQEMRRLVETVKVQGERHPAAMMKTLDG
jgi:aryl-alcohol dehydrogenase-like predicted oxidoreductase